LEPEEQAEEDFDAVVSEDFARLFEETGQLSAEDLDMFAGEETEAFSDEDMLFISEEAESAAEAEEEFADADAFMPEWLQVVMDETVSGTDISSPRLKAEEPAGAEEPETTAEAEEQPEPVPPEASAVEEPLEEDIYYGVDSTLFEKIDEGIRAASERADLAKEAEAETAGEDVPDWLEVPEEDTRGLFSERDDQFIGMTSEMAAVSPWISEEDEEEPEETGEFSAAEAELPGWLGEESEIEIQVSEEVGKIEEDFLPVEDESVDDVELPSWMDEPEEESADSYASAIEKVSGGTAELPAWMLDEEEAEEESFEDFGFSETFEETEAVEETAASPFMMDSAEMRELASALDSVEEPAYGTGGLEERGEFDGSYDEGRIADQADDRVEFGAMSDWLTGFGMEGVPAEETPVSERSAEEHSEVGETVSLDSVRDSLAIEAEAAQAPQDELLEPLPEWLDGDQQRLEFGSQGSIEESGPLEGLRGLLPGAAGLFDYSHARVSAGARVGTQDPEKVQLLRDVLDSEHHGKRIRVVKERNDFTGARLVFGILLVLILAVSMWLLPSPSARGLITNPPTQVVQFYQLMFNRMSIMPNQPVLVAFDFQPAYYAEMKAESEQVLKLLMQMHVPIARVSTVAESTLTSDLLMRHVVETYQLDYSIQNRSVNLGYLAGGNTAIRNFAMAPRENTHGLDVGTAGLYVWDRDLLAGIQSLNDFSMIIIMTDDLDTARLWLEQVQPTLSDEIPLFMISSAQISPMLKPYLTSGQIDGMLGSVLDAAAYATLTEETNWAVLNWNAYRFAIYLMIFALLGGIIYQVVIRTMIKPGKKARRAKAGSK
ncbi:MAG: hypothetical protein JW750_10060, partial [Anaerolineaceae bacterium]|nr:hypothetical protein [Anaerolineaceae bacterium]